MARPKKYIVRAFPASTRFSELLQAVQNDSRIEVRGVGTFEVVHIPEKRLFHNFSGRVRVVDAYKKLKFTQSHLLKNLLSK